MPRPSTLNPQLRVRVHSAVIRESVQGMSFRIAWADCYLRGIGEVDVPNEYDFYAVYSTRPRVIPSDLVFVDIPYGVTSYDTIASGIGL